MLQYCIIKAFSLHSVVLFDGLGFLGGWFLFLSELNRINKSQLSLICLLFVSGHNCEQHLRNCPGTFASKR